MSLCKSLWNEYLSMEKAEKPLPINHKEKISGPHFLFSAENPKYPHKNQVKMNHEQVLNHLKSRGLDAHEVNGHYGAPEKSIAVYGVTPKHAEKLHGLASRLGQDSSIYSTGKQHEMRFHHGSDAGNKVTGSGTVFHSQKPEDFFTTLPSGQHFTHNFNFGKAEAIKMSQKDFVEEHKKLLNVLKHPSKDKLEDEYKEQSEELKEKHLDKAEDTHTKLVHYSSQPNLKSIDPKFQGKGGADSQAKGRESWHKHAFFYREGTQPEHHFANSGHKYSVHLDNKTQPIYDIGEDKHGFIAQTTKENNGALNMDNVYQKLKDSGYHGFHNSKHQNLSHVVAMFHPQEVKHHEKLS